MKNLEGGEQELVGPRAHEREEKERVVEDVDSKGVPLYFAFLSDPDALVTSKEEIQDAKNALQRMKAEKPDVILMCTHKTVDECWKLVHPAEAA